MPDNRCAARSLSDRCERPVGHTGTHLAKIATTGQHTWPNLLDSEAPREEVGASPIQITTTGMDALDAQQVADRLSATRDEFVKDIASTMRTPLLLHPTPESEMETMDYDTKYETDLCGTVAVPPDSSSGMFACRRPDGHTGVHRDGDWYWASRGETALHRASYPPEARIPLTPYAQVEPAEEAPFTRVTLTIETEHGEIRRYERTAFRNEDGEEDHIVTRNLLRETMEAIEAQVGQ